MYYLILTAYWFLFWRKFLFNPFLLCTSEIASTFFPHWLWMGRQLKAGVFPAQDDIYYKLPGSIPFLATFYPPNLLTAWIGSFLKEDHAFRLYVYMILVHYLICSFFAFKLFGNLFGAITLTYAGYVIKPNTPTFVFTATWVPLALIGGHLGALAFNMSLLGGYYPILVYVLPVVAVIEPYSLILGVFLAMPQLLPFWGYFKRSIRMKEKGDKDFGKVPAFKLLDFINPIRNIGTTNGVHYPEMMMYMGIAIVMLSWSWWNLVSLIAVLIVLGVLPFVQRIPARALYLLTFSICAALRDFQCLPILILQAFLLLKNSSIYPSFPFAQWWDRPSRLYLKSPKSYRWPFNTGYRENRKLSDYVGAFRLAN